MTRRLALVLAAAATAGLAGVVIIFMQQDHAAPETGVPEPLAVERAGRISALSYTISLRVPRARDESVRGSLTATFDLADSSRPLAFDFAQPQDRLLGVVANGSAIETQVTNGHVLIPASRLVRGPNTITFEFVSGDEALNRHDDFLYSLFVPARASTAFPCFDQPDLKARWQLTLEVPQGWRAVSNGAETGRVRAGDRLSLLFEATAPLPPYLFAFAAGDFGVETAAAGDRSFRVFHRETDRSRIDRNLSAIAALHAQALDWLEAYTGILYPFGKFDVVLVPAFQFSGMEHPGAIYYNAGSLLLEPTATQNQLLSRANVIAHETSHMWFGNLVTMTWFNDVWMKEVFANAMAAKIVNPAFPAMNHDLRFLHQHYPAAYDVDRTDGANPIRQQLGNLDDAGSLYGAIIYQKAPIVMRQLELIVGPETFRDALRRYLQRHSFGTAGWPDLVAAIDELTPLDVTGWSRAWVLEAGRPTIATEIEIVNGTIGRLAFRQHDPRGRGLVWPQQLHVAVGTADRVHTFAVTLDAAEILVPAAAGLPTPRWILPVGGGLGYGFFDLDPTTLEFLQSSLHEIDDPLARGAALVALWESMLEGRVLPERVFDELLKTLPVETDELNTQQMLDQIRALFWRFTPADRQLARAPALEAAARAGLARAGSTSLKAAWFGLLRAVTLTAPTLDWLERVWRREAAIPGLPLAETDESDLAFDLALRGVPSAPEILRAQLDRIENPDRRARFAFITPALSNDASERARFFDALRDRRNRGREAWIVDAVRYLHHPLRADQSKRHVLPALDLLAEIQRTGDIFFPKRWADATLGGYSSPEVAADVRRFIDALPPDYPLRLRWLLLASADPLFRAARVMEPPTGR